MLLILTLFATVLDLHADQISRSFHTIRNISSQYHAVSYHTHLCVNG